MQPQGPLAARSPQARSTSKQLPALGRKLQLRETRNQLYYPQINGEEPAPVAEVVSSTTGPLPGSSNRVQKTKRKSVSNNRNPSTLEKAIKAAEDAESKVNNAQSKACCASKQPPVTTGSSNTSPAPTTGNSSPNSHEEAPPPFEPACCSTERNQEPESKPLNIQLETRKQSTGYPSVAQVQGWKHMTVHGASAPKTVVEETTGTNGSCCGGGKGLKEAPHSQGAQRLSLSTPNGMQPRHQNHHTNGADSRIQSGEQPFEQNQQIPYYGAQQQLANPIQSNSYTSTRPGPMSYIDPRAPSDQFASFYPFGFGSQLPNGYSSVPDFQHNCTCGDACACLGCAVHPRNETTVRYLQDVTTFMIHDPFYAGPSSPSYDNGQVQYQPSFHVSGPANSGTGNHAWQGPKLGRPFQQRSTFKHPGAPYTQEINGVSMWQSSNGPSTGSVHTTPTTELSQYSLQGPPNDHAVTQDGKQDFEGGQLSYQQPSSYDSSMRNAHFSTPDPAPSTATAETPTLSPSSFFWQQVELPGCDDPSGACRCGDGCQCVGCLTHGGHDGVPLSQANNELDRCHTGYQAWRMKEPPGLPSDWSRKLKQSHNSNIYAIQRLLPGITRNASRVRHKGCWNGTVIEAFKHRLFTSATN
ncbi:hypothetical protein MPH_01892 [Macrophomina phaseolina MS6]|uniref:Uncharacterized protein n=1 Tax=Macrophomina phaseolina (strain MS6) TaxID=1126212 RepID=K2S1B8_MACPH|nr:hypothetical protein MPH_01892 [Macrophomina phaseolina MS6]